MNFSLLIAFIFLFLLFSVKTDEMYSWTAVGSVLSIVASWYWWVPLHTTWLNIYAIVLDFFVRSPFGSNLLNLASKHIANYLSGILENRDNFPADAILAFR